MEKLKIETQTKVDSISNLVKDKFGMTMTEAIQLLKQKGL